LDDHEGTGGVYMQLLLGTSEVGFSDFTFKHRTLVERAEEQF